MNKFHFLGIAIVISIVVTVFGAWAKITHQAYANTVLTIGTVVQAITVAGGAWILAGYLGNKKDK